MNRAVFHLGTEKLFDLVKLAKSWDVNEEKKNILDDIFNCRQTFQKFLTY